MYTDDLQALLDQHGSDLLFMVPLRPLRNVLGLISYTSSNDDELMMPAKVTERRYEIKRHYKVELEATHPGFEVRAFYISDLANLIRQGQVQVFVPAYKAELEVLA